MTHTRTQNNVFDHTRLFTSVLEGPTNKVTSQCSSSSNNDPICSMNMSSGQRLSGSTCVPGGAEEITREGRGVRTQNATNQAITRGCNIFEPLVMAVVQQHSDLDHYSKVITYKFPSYV